MTAVPESVRDRLLKIKRLADEGAPGEAEAAADLLAKQLAKHGVTLADLVASSVEKRGPIFARDRSVFKLLLQIIAARLGTSRPRLFGGSSRRTWVMCTAEEFVDIVAMFEHYRRELAVEQRRLASAFFQRHQLLAPADENAPDPTPEEIEEYFRTAKMAQGLNSRTYFKPAGHIS